MTGTDVSFPKTFDGLHWLSFNWLWNCNGTFTWHNILLYLIILTHF